MSSETSNELRRVLDAFIQPVRALENLERPVKEWDDWLIYFLANKLDSSTRKDWETSLANSTDIPSFSALQPFLESQLHTLSALKSHLTVNNPYRATIHQKPHKTSLVRTMTHHMSANHLCGYCQGKHMIIFCPQFRAKSPGQRLAFVRSKQLCLNCLRPNHMATTCKSNHCCKRCQQRHHTMIHDNDIQQLTSPVQQLATVKSSSKEDIEKPHSTSVTSAHITNDRMCTRMFISLSSSKVLNLGKKKVAVSISGVGQTEAGVVEAAVTFEISSMINDDRLCDVKAFVLPKLTNMLPSQYIEHNDWPHIEGLQLADPDFDKPAQIDMILGADIYATLLHGEIRHGPAGTPVAQSTALGWVLFGPVQRHPNVQTINNFHISTVNLYELLHKFWETEEPPHTSTLSLDELECEDMYKASHHRQRTGRYIVKLPFKSKRGHLGNSRAAALAALHRMERRFARDDELQDQYITFMREYATLNHMELIQDESKNEAECYYLPHHAVLKPSSTTTKLRVVFNASQHTTSGYSLNDVLHTGPKVQNDISVILLKWRLFPYVLTADIEKMYRQILVEDNDADYQRILWRENPEDAIRCYRLSTVTYGTASAPYLACRTLIQLANDHQDTHPTAAQLLKSNFYVNDALFGAYDKESAVKSRDELRELLTLGCFKLRNWLSNDQSLLESMPPEDLESGIKDKIVSDFQVKTLGVNWNPTKDSFCLPVSFIPSNTPTKRTVLSDASRLYDPLGWISIIIINAKIFLQKLWLSKLDWDDPLPQEMVLIWQSYKTDLLKTKEISINRWVGTTSKHCGIEIHGFSDASLLAYGAAVYLRIVHDIDNVDTMLLVAKSKVSPLKAVSLPRLELCGAALLAELIATVQQVLNFSSYPVFAWTDSTIVLAWLKEHPAKWKVYVANRVSFIHNKIPCANWRHVKSGENPADLLTRGLTVAELKDNRLWWHGPMWLVKNSNNWPKMSPCETSASVGETRSTNHVSTSGHEPHWDLLQRYSSLNKLLRITAYCRRFLNNARQAPPARLNGSLTTKGYTAALILWLRIVQAAYFKPEISSIQQNKPIPSSSKIKMLNPYVDQLGLMRLGGRLKNANLSADEKCPIILPNAGRFTELLIQHSHSTTLHGGTQLTLHHIRDKYWILRGRSKVRQIIHKCVICCRYKAKTLTQLMGDLPKDRVKPAKPFLHAGVDFAGPFSVIPVKRRGQKSIKLFVAVFICLVTRAVHLELVFDLTADAFISAFKRFVSRRGRCTKMYSDNGTNFVGAVKILQSQIHQVSKHDSMVQTLLNEGTEWRFIPPASPHFGGIWESAVKSFKHHLRRVVGNTTLSVEEMMTVTNQIEACLNSRPLYAMSDDPEDVNAITPGHFLLGEKPICIPSPDFLSTSDNRLTRWELVQKITQDLWRRWHKDYIHHLQTRNKWYKSEIDVKPNDLVLVKEENLPPGKWSLARVIKVHPGSDGHVRVVTLRTKDGIFKRPIAKLCILPTRKDE